MNIPHSHQFGDKFYLRTAWRATFGSRRRKQFIAWIRRRMPDRLLYGKAFYARHDVAVSRSSSVMAASIVRELRPQSVVDVGCGNGWLLHFLSQAGCCDLQGFEYSSAGRAQTAGRNIKVAPLDLEGGFAWGRGYSACCCFEVAEHVSASFADNVVSILTSLAPVIIFSAAVPGQGGVNHVNEQPHEYWIEKFGSRGFEVDRRLTATFRKEWTESQLVSSWYCNNTLVLRS